MLESFYAKTALACMRTTKPRFFRQTNKQGSDQTTQVRSLSRAFTVRLVEELCSGIYMYLLKSDEGKDMPVDLNLRL